jgi:ATP-dependent Zn protease
MNSEQTSHYRIPARTWIVWLSVFCGIGFLMLMRNRWQSETESMSQHRFEELMDGGRIIQASVTYDNQSPLNEIYGIYADGQKKIPFRTKVRMTGNLEERLFSMPQFEAHQTNTMLTSIIWSLLPIFTVAAMIWFFFIRRIKRIARTSPGTLDLQEKASQQLDRFEKILDRWDDQARRMDVVLEKLERIK